MLATTEINGVEYFAASIKIVYKKG